MTKTSDNEYVEQLTYGGLRYAARVVPCASPQIDPIVLLCGLYQDMNSYRRFDKYWSDRATVVSVDLPGSHTTDPVPDEVGYDLHAAALKHALDSLGFERVNLVGVSFGFSPAHRFAQQHPSRLASLVLSGAAGFFRPGLKSRMVDGLTLLEERRWEEWSRVAVDVFMNQDPQCTVRNREVLSRALFMKFSSVREEHLRGYIGASRRCIYHPATFPGGIRGVRTLCLTGEHDTVADPVDTRALAAEIDGAVHTTVRETDHLVFQERPAEWTQTLLRFFLDQPLDDLDHLKDLEVPSRALGAVGAH